MDVRRRAAAHDGLQLDTPKRQRAFVDLLADHSSRASASAPASPTEACPTAIVEAARERDLPLVEVPYDVPFIAVTEAAFSRLVNEQYAFCAARSPRTSGWSGSCSPSAASTRSSRARDADRRQRARLRRARRRCSCGAPSARSSTTARSPSSAPSWLPARAAASARASRPAPPTLAGRALVLPVRASGARELGETEGGAPLQAWLVAVKDEDGFSELDRLTLHQAVTIVALELLRRRIAEDTERRLAGDVLNAIVSGDLAGPELVRRLEPFGLSEQVGAIVLAAPRPGGAALGEAEAALATALRGEATQGLVARSEGLGVRARARPRRGRAVRARGARRRARRAHARRARRGSAPAARSAARRRGGRSTRRAARSRRARWRRWTARSADGNGHRTGCRRRDRPRGGRHLSRPRLLPAAAGAAGRRRAAALLRLDPRADRAERGRLRRRADALARGVHRGERQWERARRSGSTATATRCATACAASRS